MSEFQIISLSDAIESISRHPAVAVGPGVTCLPGTMSSVFERAFNKIGHKNCSGIAISELSYRAELDSLAIASPADAGLVSNEIRKGLQELTGSLDLPYLAKAGWSSCISLTGDMLFESALRNYQDSKPASLSATLIDNPSDLPPDRTIPIYKLLGNINSSEDGRKFADSESELLMRQQIWPGILRTAPDYLQDAPLFFVGTSEIKYLVRSLLGVLLAMPKPNVSRLLFLKDDATLTDPTIRALCRQRKVLLIDANIRELSNALATFKPKARREILIASSGNNSSPLQNILLKFDSLISLVPANKFSVEEVKPNLPKLIDALFRPASIDWQPFQAGLDLRRTITDKVLDVVAALLNSPLSAPLQSIIVHGEAGIGKTLLLKRVATDLAASGKIVIWCKRVPGNYLRAYREISKELSDFVKENSKLDQQIIIFCDDPWSLRIDATDILSCFDSFPGKIVFVFSVRNTDYFANDIGSLSGGLAQVTQIEVPFEIDEKELNGLAEMLQRIGAVKNKADAEREVSELPKRDAKDILCSMWLLFPETRSQFTESLRDEYCRLGTVKDSVAAMASELAATSKIAHRAYEFVTVVSNLDIGLPIEVLVRALGIDYEEWLDMTVDGRPLWGLLYDEVDQENKSVLFRTRNNIITRILLDLVNGGVGHAGEIRVLKELLKSCEAGSTVYRSFVMEILVRARAKLSKMLNYDQGIELFDIARLALSHDDRVLEHQKGIWMQNVGHRYSDAYAQFEHALVCQVHPGAERDAPQEHIHTSMAAAVVHMVKQGEQNRITGLEIVRAHLKQASGPNFFNLHTAHVSANLLFELAQQGGYESGDKTSFVSLAEALVEIEKAFQIIGAHVRGFSKHEKSIIMLTDLQRKILASIPNVQKLKKIAQKIFDDSRDQIGFDVASRRLLIEANEAGKGKLYNEVSLYIEECIHKISEKGLPISAELIGVKIDLVIRWKIQRHAKVNWIEFRDEVGEFLKRSQNRDNVMRQFYYAVALLQCGDSTDANAAFAGLRRMRLSAIALSPREIRCYYLNEDGDPKRFQGRLEKTHQQWYFNIPELDLTIMARSSGSGGGSGAVGHAYIGFTLNGPLAVFEKPGEYDYILS